MLVCVASSSVLSCSTVPAARPHARRGPASPPASRVSRLVAAVPPLALASGRLQPGLAPPQPRPAYTSGGFARASLNHHGRRKCWRALRPQLARACSFVNRRPSPRLNRSALRVAARRRLSSRSLLAFGRGPGSGAPPAARATSAAAPDPGARAYWLLRREREGRGPAPPLSLPPAGAGCSLYVAQLLTRCSGGITPARPVFS